MCMGSFHSCKRFVRGRVGRHSQISYRPSGPERPIRLRLPFTRILKYISRHWDLGTAGYHGVTGNMYGSDSDSVGIVSPRISGALIYLHTMRGCTRRPGRELSRRELVLATGAVGLSAFAGCTIDDSSPPSGDETETGATITGHSSPDLEKWVDEVPRPDVLEPSGTKEGQLTTKWRCRRSSSSSTATCRRRPSGDTTAGTLGRRSKPSRANRSMSGGRTTCRTNTSCPWIRRCTATRFRTTCRGSGL